MGLLHLSLRTCGVMQGILFHLQYPCPRWTSEEQACARLRHAQSTVPVGTLSLPAPPSRGAALRPSRPAVSLACVTWLGFGASVEQRMGMALSSVPTPARLQAGENQTPRGDPRTVRPSACHCSYTRPQVTAGCPTAQCPLTKSNEQEVHGFILAAGQQQEGWTVSRCYSRSAEGSGCNRWLARLSWVLVCVQ